VAKVVSSLTDDITSQEIDDLEDSMKDIEDIVQEIEDDDESNDDSSSNSDSYKKTSMSSSSTSKSSSSSRKSSTSSSSTSSSQSGILVTPIKDHTYSLNTATLEAIAQQILASENQCMTLVSGSSLTGQGCGLPEWWWVTPPATSGSSPPAATTTSESSPPAATTTSEYSPPAATTTSESSPPAATTTSTSPTFSVIYPSGVGVSCVTNADQPILDDCENIDMGSWDQNTFYTPDNASCVEEGTTTYRNQIENWCLLDSYQSCSFVYGYGRGTDVGFYGQDVYTFFSGMVDVCSTLGQLVAVVSPIRNDTVGSEQSFCFVAKGYESACLP